MQSETPYHQYINLVLDYINTHLDDDLSLDMLASIANFSPFHFHRIFKDMVGQTLNQYVNRARIEHATKLLRSDRQMRIIDAAIASGYQSAEGFSRAFKKQYGMSPRQWNRYDTLQDRKISQVSSEFPVYTEDELQQFAIDHDARVKLTNLPHQQIAYIRVDDAYQQWPAVLEAHDTLMAWYSEMSHRQRDVILYGMSQDDPDVTPIEQCRFDWAIPTDHPIEPSEGISYREMNACQLAYIHTNGNLRHLDKTWQYLWRYWLPRSRYKPDNLPAMEIYQQLPRDLGWEQFDMWCAIPIIEF